MSTLLYIDTSGNIATVALSQNGVMTALQHHENAHEQAAVLNTMIEATLQEQDISLEHIDAVCVCAGPGSYTGLRVGLGAAKGICYALNKPILLFNRLDLLAMGLHSGKNFAIALKARTDEYFFAEYAQDGTPVKEPQHVMKPDLATWLQETPDLLLVTDDGGLTLTENKITIAVNYPVAINDWINKAEQRYVARQFDDLAYCEPFYLKAAYTTQSKK